MSLRQFIDHFKHKKVVEILTTADPGKMLHAGDAKLIGAFRRALRVPAYQSILKERGVDADAVQDIPSYRKLVPTLTKESFFQPFELHEYCVDGSLENITSYMTSSGHTGVFSFGVIDRDQMATTTLATDSILEYGFHIDEQTTLFINALPMGVRVFSNLPVVDVSVRCDMAIAILQKVSKYYKQTLIITDPYFLKHLIEEGCRAKIPWATLNVSFITGGDFLTEPMRRYLEWLTELNFAKVGGRVLISTMGVAELELNMFHETRQSVLIRRLAYDDVEFRKALFGEASLTQVCPQFMHYYPHRIFLETDTENGHDDGELLFSVLNDKARVPLMRYRTGDSGRLITYDRVMEVLREFGHLEMIPDLKLPFVAVYGRTDKFVVYEGHRITPLLVEQGLYEDMDVAKSITGQIFLHVDEGHVTIELQMQKGIEPTDELRTLCVHAAMRYLPCEVPVTLYRYQEYPHGMDFDFERKIAKV
jgi:phenylacetate-CoA ligase